MQQASAIRHSLKPSQIEPLPDAAKRADKSTAQAASVEEVVHEAVVYDGPDASVAETAKANRNRGHWDTQAIRLLSVPAGTPTKPANLNSLPAGNPGALPATAIAAESSAAPKMAATPPRPATPTQSQPGKVRGFLGTLRDKVADVFKPLRSSRVATEVELMDFLKFESNRKELDKFLVIEFSRENYAFLDQTDKLARDLPTLTIDEQEKRLGAIINSHIEPQSKDQVNISAGECGKILDEWKKQQALPADKRNYSKLCGELATAQGAVVALVRRDSYPRLQRNLAAKEQLVKAPCVFAKGHDWPQPLAVNAVSR